MTTLPSIQFLDQARTESEIKTQFFGEILNAVAGMPGGAEVGPAIIASGTITPVNAAHTVDTENAAAADDLERMAVTEHPNGRLVTISCADNSRTVTVKHAAAGVGQILLNDEKDLVLSDTRDRIVLQRNGDNWEEIHRTGPSFLSEGLDADILRADTPDLLQAVYGDEAQTHTGTDLAGLAVSRNHVQWTLAADSQFSDATLPYDGTYVFHVYPAGNALTLSANYKTDGSLETPDAAAGEIRIAVERYNSRTTIVSLQNMEA